MILIYEYDNLFTVTGWLKRYCLYMGKSSILAVMLLNFWRKFMDAMIIYILCTWKSCMQECMKARYEACA